MMNSKATWWVWIIAVGLTLAGVGFLVQYFAAQNNPCLIETKKYLVEQHPNLKILDEAQQKETSQLLSLHREQDVMMNLQMSSANITPEQALQLSMLQINQIAEIRKRHNNEFNNLCHSIVSK